MAGRIEDYAMIGDLHTDPAAEVCLRALDT
jgi:hypothetical protein